MKIKVKLKNDLLIYFKIIYLSAISNLICFSIEKNIYPKRFEFSCFSVGIFCPTQSLNFDNMNVSRRRPAALFLRDLHKFTHIRLLPVEYRSSSTRFDVSRLAPLRLRPAACPRDPFIPLKSKD
jgi:hypothetical protein